MHEAPVQHKIAESGVAISTCSSQALVTWHKSKGRHPTAEYAVILDDEKGVWHKRARTAI